MTPFNTRSKSGYINEHGLALSGIGACLLGSLVALFFFGETFADLPSFDEWPQPIFGEFAYKSENRFF